MWRIFAYLGLVLFIVGFAGLFVMFSNANNGALIAAVLTAFFGGATLRGFCSMATDEEIGITMHFAWYPGPAKHKVTIQLERSQLNVLVLWALRSPGAFLGQKREVRGRGPYAWAHVPMKARPQRSTARTAHKHQRGRPTLTRGSPRISGHRTNAATRTWSSRSHPRCRRYRRR